MIGVDPGSVRVGVAITDGAQTVASGLTVLVRGRDRALDRQALADLVLEEGAVGVVVGLPLSLDGSLGPAARATLEEVDALRDVLETAEVEMWDERFTTMSAARALGAGGDGGGRHRRRRSRQVIDQVAAAVLLQSWLDSRRTSRDRLVGG